MPSKLNESYRYSKYFDNAFLRDTLLEHYAPDEVHEAVPEYEISWQDTSGKQRFKILSATPPTGVNTERR